MLMLFLGGEGGVEKESLAFSVCTAAGQNSSFSMNRQRERERIQDALLLRFLLFLLLLLLLLLSLLAGTVQLGPDHLIWHLSRAKLT